MICETKNRLENETQKCKGERMAKIKILRIISFCFLCGVVFNVSVYSRAATLTDDLYTQVELFSDVLSTIERAYVEEVESKEMIYGALKGMMASLDPYSQFMAPDVYKELQVETEGQFGGLGIEITIKNNLLTIITPLDGTPADKAGLKAQDHIVKIDGKITRDITLTDAVKKMRGKPGTDVKLTVMRDGEDELKNFVITRDIIKIKSVKKSLILEDNIGYLKLTDFSEKTNRDLQNALDSLEKQGMDSLIFDLRNNPGGLLISAVDTASKFLPAGKLVVYTKGRSSGQTIKYKAKGKTHFKDIPLVVLINPGSASASEIVAGAIQDYKRGVILGTTSFGKGSVQTVVPLRDGSALRLTTAKYYTPLDRMINGKGIVPDVVVKREVRKQNSKEEKQRDVFSEIEKKEKSKIEINEQDKQEDNEEATEEQEAKEVREFIANDNQLQAAINVIRGIKIYVKDK